MLHRVAAGVQLGAFFGWVVGLKGPSYVDRILGLCWGYIGIMENGNYYLGFRV